MTKLNPFGAFVEIEPRIQGLSHVTEFGTKIQMESQIMVGGVYSFQILEINPQEHRMSLKLADQSLSSKAESAKSTEKQEPAR